MNQDKIKNGKDGEPRQINLWRDKKFVTGFILVVTSIVLGFYGKVLIGVFVKLFFIDKIFRPFSLISGVTVWVVSWILLFAGIFLVGLETIKMIQNKISQNVRKTVKSTYNHAKKLPGIIKRKKWQRRH